MHCVWVNPQHKTSSRTANWGFCSYYCLLCCTGAAATLCIAEEGPCARHLADSTGVDASSPGAASAAANGNSSSKAKGPMSLSAGQQQQQQQQPGSTAGLESRQQPDKAAGSTNNSWKQQQQQQQQQQAGPKLAGRPLNGCWTCGVERNLRSKHCPFCK